MLDPQSEQIREVYAFFGLAIHNAQSLERELAMVVATTEASERFTAWDYDDRLAGNFDSTFGALVKEFSRVAAAEDKSLLSELEKAVEERNELVHRYFWNRAVQFNSMDGRANVGGADKCQCSFRLPRQNTFSADSCLHASQGSWTRRVTETIREVDVRNGVTARS